MILRSMSVILMVLIGLFPYVRGYSLNQGGETVQFTWSSYPNERPIIGMIFYTLLRKWETDNIIVTRSFFYCSSFVVVIMGHIRYTF